MSTLTSSEEKTNGFKLMRLIVDGGTDALRKFFLTIHESKLKNALTVHHRTLYELKKKRIITQQQWDKLYPPIAPNIQEFDISLLFILLRHISGLSAPSTGWNDMPSPTDTSPEANIVRVKQFRNNFFGHVPETDVSWSDFETRWEDVSNALLGLGLDRADIDRLRQEECGEEEVSRVRKEWSESDRVVISKLDNIENMFKASSLKQEKSSLDKILTEGLHWYDFKEDIQLLGGRHTEGTREWVFKQVLTWLNDESSDNRTLIISGPSGMGKSIIAAIVCERFPNHFAGCHFFEHNNTRYNDTRFLLQSLACQLCDVIPEYKQNLTRILSGNKGKILDDMNIAGLFSMLFEEAITNISNPGQCGNLLIVIDALDECREDERYMLVDLIANRFHRFPRFIRFLITTRPETDIARKFEKLTTIPLNPDNEQNLNDVKFFVENNLEAMTGNASHENVETVVKKSQGLMLVASFLCELSEHDSIQSLVDIDEIYESYFQRLEGELENLGVDEEKFLSLLSVIAVAKEPLPLVILDRLFSSEKDSEKKFSAGRTLLKLKSRVSLLFVIKDDCVSFLHKSEQDWLVKSSHRFSINENYGHKTLADVCVSQMEMLKQNKVSLTDDAVTKYALRYGIPHILQTEKNNEQVFSPKLLDCVTDLAVVHASVCIDVYKTINNFVTLPGCKTYNSLSPKMQKMIKSLTDIIRKFISISKDKPQLFLKYVEDENMAELSAKASALQKTRYRKLEYFDSEVGSNVSQMTSYEKVACVDISASEDYLVCGYRNGQVELFSLSDFETCWKKPVVPDDVVAIEKTRVMIDSLYGIPRFVVFHPLKNVIFPGQLDLVLNFEGELVSWPLKPRVEKSYVKFTNCCFSPDKENMATHYGNQLTVWNLANNTEIFSDSYQSKLYSILFSADGRFLATAASDGLRVYNSENNYDMTFKKIQKPNALIATFGLHSWYCWTKTNKSEGKSEIVKYNLTSEPVPKNFRLLPMNARAAALWPAFMESDGSSWIDKLKDHNVFILRDGKVLVFRYGEHVLKLFTPSELINVSIPVGESSNSV